MKKLRLLIVGIIALFVLAACGKSQALDKSEVLAKTIEESKGLESYSIDMNMEMEMLMEGMDMKYTIEAAGDVTQDPEAMHLEMTMGIFGANMEMEMYMLEDEGYMGMMGQWVKMDSEELGTSNYDQLNEEELEKLRDFEEHFEMTEEENEYILTLSGNKEEYVKLVEDLMFSSMEQELDDATMEEMMDSLKVNKFEMAVHVDKEIFVQTKQVFNVEVEFEESGMTAEIKMNGDAKITNVNGVDSIEIPADIIENAVSEDEMFGMESYEDEFEFDEEELLDVTYTIQELTEVVPYSVPEPKLLPEGYVFTEAYYDEDWQVVTLSYDKDFSNWFLVESNPVELLGLADLVGESITVRGGEGIYHEEQGYHSICWEQDGLLIELGASGELTQEQLLEIAESI